MAVTLFAAYLIGSKRPERRVFGFSMFILSNVLWIVWGWHDEAWALITLQAPVQPHGGTGSPAPGWRAAAPSPARQ